MVVAGQLISWTFRVNYILFLFNIVLVGFPMDSGRFLQCILWPRVGYRQATLTAVFAGFVCCVLLGIFSMWQNEMIALALCLFIFISCKSQWMILETGGDDALLGQYDFSQGYTSLERHEPPAPRVVGKAGGGVAATAGGEEDTRDMETREAVNNAWTSCWTRFSAKARDR